MILKVRDNSGGLHTVHKILRINTASANIRITGSSGKITISDTRESRTAWYAAFIDRKVVGIHSGGNMPDGFCFNKGISVYTERDGKPYIRTIAGTVPSSSGNIQLLPGNTLDIVPAEGRISFEQIKIPAGGGGLTHILEDIYKCIWYLYHTYNSFIYRLNVWSPNTASSPMFTTTRMLGTIPAYQAVVAAWNLRVWRRSFLWDISPIRENISFDVGYMALECKNPNVTCVVTIYNDDPNNDDTTKFFTVYDQGISTNISGSISRTIVKTVGTADGSEAVIVDGSGSDTAAMNKLNWSKIEIVIALGTLSQGEYYKAAFSLAVAQNETTALYYQSVANKTNKLRIVTKWTVDAEDGSRDYTIDKTYDVKALLTYKEETSESDEEDYIK